MTKEEIESLKKEKEKLKKKRGKYIYSLFLCNNLVKKLNNSQKELQMLSDDVNNNVHIGHTGLSHGEIDDLSDDYNSTIRVMKTDIMVEIEHEITKIGNLIEEYDEQIKEAEKDE